VSAYNSHDVNLSWLLDSSVAQVPVGDPNAVAIVIGPSGNSLTYEALRKRRNSYAKALMAQGVSRGDRVGMFLMNSLDYIALYFAITYIGAVAVRLNFRLGASELSYVLADSDCKLVFVETELLDVVSRARTACKGSRYFALGEVPDALPQWLSKFDATQFDGSDLEELISPTQDQGAMIMYTSGTTGHPKGALWTHGNLLWFAAMQALKFRYSPATVAMTTGPLYHVGAFEDLLLPALLSHGRAVLLQSRGFSIDRLVETLRAESVTDVLLYPFMLYDLLRRPEITRDTLPALQRIVCGGDSIMPWAVEVMRRQFPRVELVQAYGLTEGGGMSTCLDDEDCRKHPNSVGRPLPLTEVRVVTDSGSIAGSGEVGEILVRSPSVCAGYWRKPTETEETFGSGWCRTGDLGSVTDDGYLIIRGRKKDMIRSGGENIYPAEIEAVLTRHPAVREAAVIGVPDERYLEVPCAVLVPSDPSRQPASDILGSYCRSELAHYKCPRYFIWVSELPRNPSGKVLKQVLREQYRDIDLIGDSAEERRAVP